jgi:NTE family protein
MALLFRFLKPLSVLRWACILAAASLAACSSVRPWVNQPLTGDGSTVIQERGASAQAQAVGAAPVAASAPPSSFVAALALSGGGARAAAVGLGVMEELKATRFEWEGRTTSLMDQIGLISGVSGGSVLASYYAAFGDEVFDRFEPEFLMADFQGGLIRTTLSPLTLYHLSSPWFGRSNALAERLESLYRGKTFGELRRNSGAPQLLVTATDLTTGAPFEFTPEQFDLICSDLDSVPLSFAVASSSAVPLLLSPMTVRNYAGQCPQSALVHEPPADANLSARLLHMVANSYRDVQERPFIHLVDGGVVDNLGVRGLLQRLSANDSLNAAFRDHPPGSIRQIVLISVNSERDTAERIDRSDKVPSGFQVLDSLVFGAGSRLTHETTAMVNDAARRMTEELNAERARPGSPFAPDAEIHVINVGLHDVTDKLQRLRLLSVPTAFSILPFQVHELERAGRQVVRDSTAFQRLKQRLGTKTPA